MIECLRDLTRVAKEVSRPRPSQQPSSSCCSYHCDRYQVCQGVTVRKFLGSRSRARSSPHSVVRFVASPIVHQGLDSRIQNFRSRSASSSQFTLRVLSSRASCVTCTVGLSPVSAKVSRLRKQYGQFLRRLSRHRYGPRHLSGV